MRYITDEFLDGMVELDGEMRLDSIISRMKHVSPYLYAYPQLYQDFHDAVTEEEKEEIRKKTPLITNEDYIFIASHVFIEAVKEKDWSMGLMGPRVIFYNSLHEHWFGVSNASLQVYLAIVAKKIGVPDRLTGSPNFSKSVFSTLKQSIRVEEKMRDIDDY